MIVSIHQPAYLPWLGYFDRISRSDIYIFLDTVQLEKNSYTYRNKIKTPQGAQWLTIPLIFKGHMASSIGDIPIDTSKDWKRKHLKSIYVNYKKSTYFDELFPKLELLYHTDYKHFSELAYVHLKFWLNELQINTTVVKASMTTVKSKKSALILDLCEQLGAKKYLSGAQGINYLDEQSFKKKSIQIEYQDYKHPIYPQLFGEYLPNLAIVDYWMNTRQTELITGG